MFIITIFQYLSSVIQCVVPDDVANATNSYSGLSPGSTVTYVCDAGYKYEAGQLTRTCLSDGSWDGIPPVCSGIILIRKV